MITSSSIPYISQALSEPQNITEADKESIEALTNAYPYFVPARYMDAIQQHKNAPYNAELMAQMQLYSGNWLLYSQFLQDVLGGEDVPMEIETVTEEATQETATEEPSVETVANDKVNTEEQVVAEESVSEEEAIQETVTEEASEDDQDDFNPGNTDFITGDQPYKKKEKKRKKKDKAKKKEKRFDESMNMDQQDEDDEALILPVYTEDYFLHQGVNVSNKIPEDLDSTEGIIDEETTEDENDEKSLMVVMSFSEWLNFFKTKKKEEEEEEEGQKALKTMWQKEKLAAALEEEDEEIPENVFEMAVNSISKEEGLVSESLANIHIKQGRYDKAIEMYRKLSLRNPQKKAYFARKIETLIKEKES